MDILLKDLEVGQDYIYQIRAKDANGQVSPWSTAYRLTTVSDTVAPGPVTGLTFDPSGTSFIATWVKPALDSNGKPLLDFRDYQVIIDTGTEEVIYYVSQPRFDFSFQQNLASFGTPEPSLTIEVRARDTVGNLSTVATDTASNPVPANVSGFTADAMNNGVFLSWAASTESDFKEFKIYESTTSGFTPGPSNLIEITSGTSFFFPATDTVEHFFKIEQIDIFNQASASFASASATPVAAGVDLDPPPIPTSVTVSTSLDTDGSAKIVVDWTGVDDSNLGGYRVRYSTDGSQWFYSTIPADVTEAVLRNLLPNQAYYVGVASFSFVNISSAYVNATTYPITTAQDNVAPSTPSAPTVSTSTLAALVNHDMTKAAGGDLESDVTHLEIHASTTTGFTPSVSTKRGMIEVSAPGIDVSGVFYYNSTDTTSNLYWKVIAVDRAGNKSAASAQTNAVPGLLSGVNIIDASINSAKINNLEANKIIAGSGIINDLLVKSNLTIDSAGHLKSSNYNVGAGTGYSLDTSNLTIFDGAITAKSLLIQDGQNLMLPIYADFEHQSGAYSTAGVTNFNNFTYDTGHISTTTISKYNVGRYGSNSLRIQESTALSTDPIPPHVFFGKDGSIYNLPADAGDYIISVWARQTTASYSQFVYLGVRQSPSGVDLMSGFALINSTTWTRISGKITVPAGQDKLCFVIKSVPVIGQTGVDFLIDGVQIERKQAGLDTPSAFKPPGSTTIDGDSITTGTIRSNADSATVDGEPAWSIDTQGKMKIGDAEIRGSLVVGDALDGINMVPVQFSNFDNASSYYHDGSDVPNATNFKIDPVHNNTKVNILTSDYQFGPQSLRIYNTVQTAGNGRGLYFSNNGNNIAGNNIRVVAGFGYMVSAYVKSKNLAINQKVGFAMYSASGVYIGSFTSGGDHTLTGSWTRIYGVYTAPSGYNDVQISLYCTTVSGTGFDFAVDGLMMERWNGLSTPSTFSDGTTGISFVESGNFQSGSNGWYIASNGDVEFNSGVFRGALDIASPSYGIKVQNRTTQWRAVNGGDSYPVSGIEPTIILKGNRYFPVDGGGTVTGPGIQSVIRLTPEGGLQLISDSSQNDRLFSIDANNDLTVADAPIDDYYGYAEMRQGQGLGREFSLAINPETSFYYDNSSFGQMTAKSTAPVSVGGGSTNTASVLVNSDASTSAYIYDPYSYVELKSTQSLLIESQNVIPDPWDIFDGVIATYNAGSTRNRITLNSVSTTLKSSAGNGSVHKGIMATITAAGTGNPLIWFAPTSTSYNVTVTPLAEYSMGLNMDFDATNSLAGMQMRFICKLSNGTILSSDAQNISDGFDIMGPEHFMASDDDVFVIPAGITSAQFGFEILNHNNLAHNVSFGYGKLYKTRGADGLKRSSYSPYRPMSREQVIEENNTATITVSTNKDNGISFGFDHDDGATTQQFRAGITHEGFQWGFNTEFRHQLGANAEYSGLTNTVVTTGSAIVPFGTSSDPILQTSTLTHSDNHQYAAHWQIDSSNPWTNPGSAGWIYTASRSGLYLGSAWIQTNSASGGQYLELYNYTNGKRYGLAGTPVSGPSAGALDWSTSALIPVSAGDKLAVKYYNFTAATRTITGMRICWAQII